jgi:hypothetical protein
MDQYKIVDMEKSILSKPLELYTDLYNGTLTDNRFNMYKYIDMDLFQHELYCISDIHADTHRFWEFLYLNKFVLVEQIPDLSEMKWNPDMKNKALVICGDIIDGRRPPNQNLHASNNNETLIHTIIYNLRLDAIKYNSYIFCTVGNHDFFAFHNGTINGFSQHMYLPYMDSNTKENFIHIFKDDVFYNYLKDKKSQHVVTKVIDNDAAYFARTYILSRFYLIGFPICLKINTILFAHAGFHKTENIFSLFDNGQNSNTQIQPLLIHRNILDKMSDVEYLISFIEFLNRRKTVPTYADYYDYIFDLVISQLHRKSFNKQLVDKYADYFKNTNSENSIIENLLLTRKLQKDCKEVDEILQTYGCKMLVVGHCPTCLGPSVFDAKNTTDITDCDDARIVFSCNKKLLTVDIAFSSGFTPMKDFLECLNIQTTLAGQFFIKIIRKSLRPSKYMRMVTFEHNHHIYIPEDNAWLAYNPGNSSNSNSEDEHNHRPPQRLSLDDLFPDNNSTKNKSARASNSRASDQKENDLGFNSKPSVMDIFGIKSKNSTKNPKNIL